MSSQQRVYAIDGETSAPPDELRELVGNKAFNLMKLAAARFRVPEAFVLTTDFCEDAQEAGGAWRKALAELLSAHVRRIENLTGLVFADRRRPLLLSVRSGAATSMPGMMDTLLNIGLCDRTVQGLIAVTGNPRLAWDSYRRLIVSFAETVHGAGPGRFSELEAAALERAAAGDVAELNTLELRELVGACLERYVQLVGHAFPQSPMEQLVAAVRAVFRSWNSERALEYRRLKGLTDLTGTAVTVQRMVFGNAGVTSGAGVAFTRDPSTGNRGLYVDFALNAQGEDIVSGRQRPGERGTLPQLLPRVYAELEDVGRRLEQAFADAQDFEFTVEDGQLYLLQTRRAQRTPWAALQLAVDFVGDGLWTPQQALDVVDRLDLEGIRRHSLDVQGHAVLARATAASAGAASGPIVFSNDAARRAVDRGQAPILVRTDTSTDDIQGMTLAAGILTAHGNRTSHAAVIARQLGKVCLVGCVDLTVDAEARRCRLSGQEFVEGSVLTLDGHSGDIYADALPMVEERPVEALERIEGWRRDGDAAGQDEPTRSFA